MITENPMDLASHSGKVGTGLEAECLLQIQLANEPIHGTLAVLTLDLPQDQAHGVAVVAAAELELRGDELAGTVPGQDKPSAGLGTTSETQRALQAPSESLTHTSKAGSFFSTPAFFSVTYLGMPFS